MSWSAPSCARVGCCSGTGVATSTRSRASGDLPGGVVEPGETEPEALERELREELGVSIDPASASHLCRVVVRPGRVPVTLSAWLVGAWDGTPANAAPEEHDKIAWLSLADLPPLAHPHVRAAVVDAAGEP